VRSSKTRLLRLGGRPTFLGRSSHWLPQAFAVFEGWAFVPTAAGDFRLRDFSVALNVRISRFLQHRAHASNTAKRGAAKVEGSQPPEAEQGGRREHSRNELFHRKRKLCTVFQNIPSPKCFSCTVRLR